MLLEVLEGQLHEILQDLSALLRHLVLLVVLSVVVAADQFFVELLLVHPAEVLCHVLGVSGCQTNNRFTASMADINTYLHSVGHLLGQLQSVQVTLYFGIYLLQQVSIHGDFGVVDCLDQQELGWNAHFVELLLYPSLFLRLVQKYDTDESPGLNVVGYSCHVTVAIFFSDHVVGDLNIIGLFSSDAQVFSRPLEL